MSQYKPPGIFLSAEWRRLINLTYAIDPELLRPHLPPGTEVDIYNGQAHVSLVAFEFLNTKVKGLKIPFHVNFPEINLRYYLRKGDYLGVAFIKELVPKFCIAYIARNLYNEPYESLSMDVDVLKSDNELKVLHAFAKQKKLQKILVTAENRRFLPEKNMPGHYFKEHDLGFGQTKKGKGMFYRVAHPVWETYPIQQVDLDFDFGAVYGEKWAFLNGRQPTYQVLAEGSEISVSAPRNLSDFEGYKHLFKGPEGL